LENKLRAERVLSEIHRDSNKNLVDLGIQRRELSKYGAEERLLEREEKWNNESDVKKKRMPIFISGLTIEKRYKVCHQNLFNSLICLIFLGNY
jgi:hypothetical protein